MHSWAEGLWLLLRSQDPKRALDPQGDQCHRIPQPPETQELFGSPSKMRLVKGKPRQGGSPSTHQHLNFPSQSHCPLVCAQN